MTTDRVLTRQAILSAVGVVLIGVGVRSNDWPIFGAGVVVMFAVVPASVIFARRFRDSDRSSGGGLRTAIAKPVTSLTLTGVVLLTACVAEFALGVLELRWVPCAVSVAAASQSSLAYVLSATAGSNRSTPRRRTRFGRIERLALSLYAMAVVLLAVNVGQL